MNALKDSDTYLPKNVYIKYDFKHGQTHNFRRQIPCLIEFILTYFEFSVML